MALRSTLIVAAVLLGLATAARATPVTGQLSLIGYDQAIGSVSVGAATGLDFVAGGFGATSPGVAGAISSYGAGYGSFAGLECTGAGFVCGAIKDIDSFANFTPISSFLSFNTNGGPAISFDLDKITDVVRTQDSAGGSLAMRATGTIHFTGLDDTAATFLLTTQAGQITSFSATTFTVPEPASLALLGGSFMAMALLRRKRA